MLKRMLCFLLAGGLLLCTAGCWWDEGGAASSLPGPALSVPGPEPGTMEPTPSPADAAGSSSVSSSASGDGASSALARKAGVSRVAAPAEGEWSLRLVNASHPLPPEFTVETRAVRGYDKRMFDARAADALEALLTAAEQEGQPLYLDAAYRSAARQNALFLRKTNALRADGLSDEAARAQAARAVARPGTSEHQLGLAVDLVSADWYSGHIDLTERFARTPHFAWLQANAARYGFVLRYPAGKEALTGMDFAPWHYRYVGPTAAGIMARDGLCLEEYLQRP